MSVIGLLKKHCVLWALTTVSQRSFICTDLSLNSGPLSVMYMSVLTFTLQKYIDPKNDIAVVSQDHNEGVFLVKIVPGSPFVMFTPSY
jgi:hypothetical protein